MTRSPYRENVSGFSYVSFFVISYVNDDCVEFIGNMQAGNGCLWWTDGLHNNCQDIIVRGLLSSC